MLWGSCHGLAQHINNPKELIAGLRSGMIFHSYAIVRITRGLRLIRLTATRLLYHPPPPSLFCNKYNPDQAPLSEFLANSTYFFCPSFPSINTLAILSSFVDILLDRVPPEPSKRRTPQERLSKTKERKKLQQGLASERSSGIIMLHSPSQKHSILKIDALPPPPL